MPTNYARAVPSAEDKSMDAKDFLMQAWEIDKRIESKIYERDRLMARLTSARSSTPTGMPRGGNYDWTDAVAAVVDMDAAIKAEILDLCRIKREVNAVIDSVEDQRLRRVLELRYRSYYTFEKIAEVLTYDVRQIYNIHNDALEAVQEKISLNFMVSE